SGRYPRVLLSQPTRTSRAWPARNVWRHIDCDVRFRARSPRGLSGTRSFFQRSQQPLTGSFTLSPCCLRELRPRAAFAVSLDQPAERVRVEFCWIARSELSSYTRLIGRPKFRCTVSPTQADSPALGDAHVPNGAAVARGLPMKKGRTRARHVG